MEWEVEFTDEFEAWWGERLEDEQEDVRAYVKLLQEHGPNLKFPYSSGVSQSRQTYMRELRIQHDGRTGCFMRLIRAESRCGSSVAIRPGTITGMTFSCPLPTDCTMSTSLNLNANGKKPRGAARQENKEGKGGNRWLKTSRSWNLKCLRHRS